MVASTPSPLAWGEAWDAKGLAQGIDLFCAKMLADSGICLFAPYDHLALRAIFPSTSVFVLPRLIALLTPQLLRRRLRPRTWLLMFCGWSGASERPWNVFVWRLGRASVLVRKAWKDLQSSETKIADDGWTII
jgi:hypothetical protein